MRNMPATLKRATSIQSIQSVQSSEEDVQGHETPEVDMCTTVDISTSGPRQVEQYEVDSHKKGKLHFTTERLLQLQLDLKEKNGLDLELDQLQGLLSSEAGQQLLRDNTQTNSTECHIEDMKESYEEQKRYGEIIPPLPMLLKVIKQTDKEGYKFENLGDKNNDFKMNDDISFGRWKQLQERLMLLIQYITLNEYTWSDEDWKKALHTDSGALMVPSATASEVFVYCVSIGMGLMPVVEIEKFFGIQSIQGEKLQELEDSVFDDGVIDSKATFLVFFRLWQCILRTPDGRNCLINFSIDNGFTLVQSPDKMSYTQTTGALAWCLENKQIIPFVEAVLNSGSGLHEKIKLNVHEAEHLKAQMHLTHDNFHGMVQ